MVAPLFNGLAARFATLSANPRFRIYNVFDQRTFSSGMLNAQDLLLPYPTSIPNPNLSVNLSTLVTSIGLPTGGKPTAYGIVTGFTLPGSGIPGQISTGFFRAPAGSPDLSSVMPSIPVSLRSTDYLARFDPVMATILSRGKGAPVPPSGDAIVVNAASFRIEQGVAPGSYAAVFGNFATAPDDVTINGAGATLGSSSSSQVNLVVPEAAIPGTSAVAVRTGGKELATGTVTISRTGPGIFIIEPANPSQPGAILNQDGTVNTPSNPAATGSVV